MILETLQAELKNKYDTEFRDGVHVSDLTLCPRKSIFRKLEPTPITNKELNFFTSGRAIHDAIQTLAKRQPRYEIEKQVEYNGVVGHIDLYDTEHNIPIECKSMRTKDVKEPKPHHVSQLKFYMAMLGADTGIILYQCLMNFDDKPFVEFEVTMNEEERRIVLQMLEIQKVLYSESLAEKKPFQAVSVIDDPKLNWQCKSCQYYQKCNLQKEADQACLNDKSHTEKLVA